MSLWNAFKKKIEKTTSGLDWWDKEENARQMQAIDQKYAQPQTPSNTGGLRVATPQRQPQVNVQDNGIFASNNPVFQNTQQSTLLDNGIFSSNNPITKNIKVTPTNDNMSASRILQQQNRYSGVNAGLDKGQSWEDISASTGIPLEEVKGYSQRTRPDYGVQKQKFIGYDIGEGQNKTFFGKNAAWALPKSLEKKYEVKAGREFEATEYALNQQFDKLNPEFRDVWLSQVNKMAQDTRDEQGNVIPGNANAKATMDALRRGGKLKGSAMDFIEGSNEKLGGGLLRGTARTVDWVLPGKNTFGLEQFADDMEGPDKVTDWGKRGENFGTAQKGAVDVVSLVIPGAVADKAVKGAKWANTGSKAFNYGARILPGSAASSAVDIAQEVGRGNDPNIGRSLAVGAAADLATPVILKPVTKVLGKGTNKISKLLSKGTDVADDEFSHITKASNLDSILSDGMVKPSNLTDEGLAEYEKLSAAYLNKGTDNPYRFTDTDNVNIVYKKSSLGKNVVNQGDELAVMGGVPNKAIDHIEVPNQAIADKVEQAGFKATIKPELAVPTPPAQTVDPLLQNAQMPKQSTTQSIGDLLQDTSRFNKKTTESVDQLLAKQYGVTEQTVRRLRNGYGEQQARNILASSSDATNIRDMNGFVISEAKKRYGSPNVAIQRTPKPSDMSPEEAASLYASAPEAKGSFEAPTPTPVTKTAKGNPAGAKESTLGKTAENFFDNLKGKNTKVTFKHLEELGQKVSRQIDDEFAAIGSDFSDVAARVQEGVRNGAKTLDDVGISPEEAQILRKAQDEMNYVRRRADLNAGREISEGNFGELYLPQQKKGQYDGGKLFEGFRDTKPGSEFTRKNKIELEDLDYSADVVGQYITRYGDTKLFREERIARALAKNNPNIPEDKLAEAASDVIRIQGEVNNLTTKISKAGLGTRKTLSDGKFIDSAAEFSGVGKKLGKEQMTIATAPKGLTNGDRINSVMIGDRTAGDFLGLNQYRDSANFASKQVIDSAGDRNELARMVEQRLNTDYNLNAEDIDYIVNGISRMSENVPDEVVLAKVSASYQQAAKQQLLEQLQNVDITNKKLRTDVSNLANQILREGTIQDEFSNKVVKKILTAQNAIFRKFNVSSALNELSDLTSFTSVYGKNTSFVPDFKAIKEFGLGDIDAAIEPYIKQVQEGKSLKSILGKINNATNLYKFVETYKAGVVASSAKKAYPDLAGDALTKAVLDDYRKIALPVDAFTKTFLDNAPLYTQYMTWGVRNIQKEGRLAAGKIAAGSLKDMSQNERIARNLYANLPAKTTFWLASNGLKGTALLTAIGLTDFTGMTEQDYSGIAPEDKSLFDKIAQQTNRSTTLSMFNKIVQSYEKDQLKKKYADKDYNPYEHSDKDSEILAMFTPQFIKNASGADEMMDKGYSENAAGRVQYEAPTDFWNTAKAYVFGKTNTENAREYSGRLNIQDRVAKGENPFGAMIDMAQEQLNIKDTDYNRPLSDKYSEAYKAKDKEGRTDLLAGGRAFNNFLDDLRDNQPEAYNRYLSSMDGNHVNPEYWKAISGDKANDLTVFNMIRDRKKQQFKDLGTAYDPIYDLPDDQARAVIQQKRAATGDDIALRNALYKEQWFKDYQNRVKEYWDSKEDGETDGENTQRVKDWYSLNDQYNALRTTATDTGERPEWSSQFPTVYAQKIINSQYGFDSEQSKNFFRQYGDQYKAEKAAYDQNQLALINQMREIEGYPPMSAEQYAQVTNIADTDSSKKSKGYSGGGSSGGGRVSYADFGRTRGLELPSVKISKTTKAKQAYKPKVVKIQRKGKRA